MAGRWTANLLLALLVLALGLVIRGELARDARLTTLAGLDPADLSLIRLDREGEPTIRIERTPAGWRMREPLDTDADAVFLDKLLAVVEAPVYRSFPAQSADLAELALSPPKLRLQLDSFLLAFGGLDPIGQRRYVAAEGLVHLIDDRFHHLLIAPPPDWVSHRLLPAGEPPVFATLGGIPLAPLGIETLGKLRAERIEPLAGELAGEAAEIKYRNGRALRFLVSEDRRRWSRLDLKLRYVLPETPLLAEDPTAVDPTPPAPLPTALAEEGAAAGVPEPLPMPALGAEEDALAPPGTFADPDAPPPVERLSPPAEPDPADPFAPIPEDELNDGQRRRPYRPRALPFDDFGPAEVRLSPDGYEAEPDPDGDPYSASGSARDDGGYGQGGEPSRFLPGAFGTDPFAPDPAYGQ